jgi:hypothetical protein
MEFASLVQLRVRIANFLQHIEQTPWIEIRYVILLFSAWRIATWRYFLWRKGCPGRRQIPSL